MQAFAELQRATLDARSRLADQSIGTQVSNGKVQVVRVAYKQSGASSVTPVSAFLPMRDAVEFLQAMQ